MKKLIVIVYFLVGLAFIAQGAGWIPLAAVMPKWFPLGVGWCFILLGCLMVIKMNRSKKSAEKTEAETEATEDKP